MIVSGLITFKGNVAFIYDDNTLRQALEKLKHHKYSAIPVISRSGKYVGTVSEGDFLWFMFNESLSGDEQVGKDKLEEVLVGEIVEVGKNPAVSLATDVEIVLDKVLEHNFIPIVDSLNNFSGIVTRRSVLKYMNDKFNKRCD